MQTRNQINRRDKQARKHGPKYTPTKSETKQKEEKEARRKTVSAKLHDLKEFIATRGTIEQRKAYFQLWATTLQEMLAALPHYQALMRYYPRLDGSELSIAGNVALAHFLRLKLTTPTLHVIESTIGKSNKLNGYLILQYLVKPYGNTTLLTQKTQRTNFSPHPGTKEIQSTPSLTGSCNDSVSTMTASPQANISDT
jgi:hypothetical protein